MATDVFSGWVEAVALLAREQTLAVAGLMRIRKQMPVTTLGIDSDNDGAFINETVASYCKAEGLAFTRSRPHHKNDQAWIEQKNGAVIRRMVGHERFSGIVAGQALAQLLAVGRQAGAKLDGEGEFYGFHLHDLQNGNPFVDSGALSGNLSGKIEGHPERWENARRTADSEWSG